MPLMAELTIGSAWLAPADDLSAGFVVDFQDIDVDTGARGEMRQYAEGTRRVVTWPGRSESLGVNIPIAEEDLIVRLDGLVGAVVVWRDGTGRVRFCWFERLGSSDDAAFVGVTMTLLPTTQGAEV